MKPQKPLKISKKECRKFLSNKENVSTPSAAAKNFLAATITSCQTTKYETRKAFNIKTQKIFQPQRSAFR